MGRQFVAADALGRSYSQSGLAHAPKLLEGFGPRLMNNFGLSIRGGRESVIDGSSDQRLLLKESFCRPFRAVRLSYLYLALKPQAESYYLFGISPTARKHNNPAGSRTDKICPFQGVLLRPKGMLGFMCCVC
jgi:hypothetical protein